MVIPFRSSHACKMLEGWTLLGSGSLDFHGYGTFSVIPLANPISDLKSQWMEIDSTAPHKVLFPAAVSSEVF